MNLVEANAVQHSLRFQAFVKARYGTDLACNGRGVAELDGLIEEDGQAWADDLSDTAELGLLKLAASMFYGECIRQRMDGEWSIGGRRPALEVHTLTFPSEDAWKRLPQADQLLVASSIVMIVRTAERADGTRDALVAFPAEAVFQRFNDAHALPLPDHYLRFAQQVGFNIQFADETGGPLMAEHTARWFGYRD